jgi:CheY-like chemotaxis protein
LPLAHSIYGRRTIEINPPEIQRILIVNDLANNIVGIEAILGNLKNVETDAADGSFEASRR